VRLFLNRNGKLQAPLVLRDSQQGFAGVSGEIWTIKPDGHFSIARFLNGRVDRPYWTRKLTVSELKELAGVLAARRFFDLPNSLGSASMVNAQLVTLTFGTKESTLALSAGEEVTREMAPPPGEPHIREWRNFVSVVLAIHDLTKNRERQITREQT
jgi:hypothetical protein